MRSVYHSSKWDGEFSLRGIGYDLESITRVIILERVAWSCCLSLHSVKGKLFES